ncbi:MAG: ribosome-associated translation inhibitor RaiA [Candidatus Colwellbacteria bacterium]|nr:ribosome-associated translation inhibitor RaiA [Candidatus Colwellbacteria bacterium]
MTINITANDLDLTPAFKEFIESKVGALNKFVERFDGDSLITNVVVSRTTAHHRHGEVFDAKIDIGLPGSIIRAAAIAPDARTAVLDACKKLEREIEKYKTKIGSR